MYFKYQRTCNTFMSSYSGSCQLSVLSDFGYRVTLQNFRDVAKYKTGGIYTNFNGTVEVNDIKVGHHRDWFRLLRNLSGGFKRAVVIFDNGLDHETHRLDSKLIEVVLKSCGFEFVNSYENCDTSIKAPVVLHLMLDGRAIYTNMYDRGFRKSSTFMKSANLYRDFIQFTSASIGLEKSINAKLSNIIGDSLK